MNPKSQEIVERFIQVAREYIDLVDRREEVGRERFLYACLRILPLVFHYAVQLPNVEPDTTGISERNRKIDFQQFVEYLGEYDASYQVWDPIGDDDVNHKDGEWEVVYHGLGDDLLDIYYDLRNPLISLDKRNGTPQNDAIWDWKFGFQNHYGQHLASAIKTLFWRVRYGSE